MADSKAFTNLFLKLSGEIKKTSLKQFTFLLEDLVKNVIQNKTFLEVITELENQKILHRPRLLRDDVLLLCELFDAIAMNRLSDLICEDLNIERDPGYKTRVSPYRKLMVSLSNHLNQREYVQRMSNFLRDSGHTFHDCSFDDSLEVLQAMWQADLISPDDSSLLTGMLASFSRQDLIKLIVDFNKLHTVKRASFGLRNLPYDMVERTVELDAVMKILNSGKNKVGVVGIRNRDVIGIRGMGGIGKTVLAQAVAWNVSKNREIIWLDIGQTPDCLALINTLVKALGGLRSFSELSAAQAWIREKTEDRDCLVILDDVWSVDHACVFDYLAGKCQLLVTTRDVEVVRGLKGSSIHELGTMGDDESRRLIYRSAQVEDRETFLLQENVQKIIEGILDECRGLPLALALVGSSLIDTRDEQDWQDVLDDLKSADLNSLRSVFPKNAYPYDNLVAAIGMSFERLEDYHQDKFLDFAVFSEDTDIPLAILEAFWSSDNCHGSSCLPREARKILNVLEKRSLIQKGPLLEGKKSYRVHDLLLDFVRGKLSERGSSIKDIQTCFVEMLRRQCAGGEWSKFPKDDKYFFTFLAYHLHCAEAFEELSLLFFEFQWLQRKVKVTSLASLISDFRYLSDQPSELKLLKSSLMLSADVIENNHDALGAQLLGRLTSYVDENPSVKRLLVQARESSSHKRLLIPLHSCLADPVGPLIKIFVRHNCKVLSLATTNSSSGTIVISSSTDHLIKVHELETGKELKVLKGHNMAVYCLASSHSGTMLASGSYDATARIWNLDNYQEVHVLEGRGGFVNALVFSVDDEKLFTGSNDGKVSYVGDSDYNDINEAEGTLKVWCVSKGDLLYSINAHDGHIRGLCATSNGLLVATCSLDHTVKLWSTKSLNLEATLKGHGDTVYAVSSSSDSKILVSASGDKTLKVWSLETFQELRTLCGHQGEIYSVALTPDGEKIISGGKDTVVRLWCLATGKLLCSFRGHSGSIRFVITTPDGSKALSGSQDKSFRVWDLDTNSTKQSEFPGHSLDVMDIAVNNSGSVCASCSMDGTLKIWHCETAKENHTLRGHSKRVVSVAVTHDGKYAVSLAKDLMIKVWNLILGEFLSEIKIHHEPRLVRFSDSGELVLVGCKNNQVSIWKWKSHEQPPRSVVLPAFTTVELASASGDVLYTCSRNNEICQVDLNREVSKLTEGPNPGSTSMVILPNGEAMVATVPTDSCFIYWELSSWREIRYNANHPPDAVVTAIDVTSDSKYVLSGSSVGTISVVDLESSEIIRTYRNSRMGKSIRFVAILKTAAYFVFVDETNAVELRSFEDDESTVIEQLDSQATSICPVGKRSLLIASENGELVLFDTTSSLGRHKGHDDAVTRLASHEIDNFWFFVSGCADGSVKLWFFTDIASPAWINVWSLKNVHKHPITSLAFAPKSKDIVSGSHSNEVLRINASGIIQRYSYKSYGIVALRVHNDSLIAVCVRGFSVVKWHLDEGHILTKCHGAPGREQVARLHLSSGRVVSKGSHHCVTYWDLHSGNTIRRLCGHTHDIRALAFVPGGAFLLSGSRDKVLKLWSLEKGELVDEFHFERYVLAIACAPNGLVCVGLQGGQVCFFRITNFPSS